MRIISERKRCVNVEYQLSFRYADDSGSGFGFDCDIEGRVLNLRSEAAKAKYEKCLSGNYDGKQIINEGVQTYTNRWVEPAVGRCSCGQKVELSSFTNECSRCNRLYNSSGQELAFATENENEGGF